MTDQRLEVKFAIEPDQIDAKTGEFSGYGAVFGNVDSHGDVIQPGAFNDSLMEWRAKGRYPAMKLMHGTAGNPFNGSDLPVGIYRSMTEDARGLKVEGKLSALDTDMGRRLYGLMKDGALDGLSIGYRAVRASRPPSGTQAKRILESVKLFEVSIVADPSNDAARMTAVKSALGIKTIREFEDFLRDAGGFSANQAKLIASHGFKTAEPRDEAASDLVEMIRRATKTLSS